MSQQRNFWMRWRVRVGYPVAAIYCVLAAPTPRSILVGGLVAAVGLAIRGSASGHLRKYEQLCTTGPYAHTRNPLYFGSAFLAGGFAVAGHSWVAGGIVGAYFAIFYYAVMRNEESDLLARYGAEFETYALRVPLFFPRLREMRAGEASNESLKTGVRQGQKAFSWSQYARNREYQALIGTIAGLGVVCLRMWLRARWGY